MNVEYKDSMLSAEAMGDLVKKLRGSVEEADRPAFTALIYSYYFSILEHKDEFKDYLVEMLSPLPDEVDLAIRRGDKSWSEIRALRTELERNVVSSTQEPGDIASQPEENAPSTDAL